MSENLQKKYIHRRQMVFLLLSGFFLGTLALLNLLGISRFVDFSFTLFEVKIPFVVAVGVLPYPLTFLCTDLISEIYGRRRASQVVWVGLLLNLWIVFILWLGATLPPQPELIDATTGLPPIGFHGRVFFEIKMLTYGAVVASMIAYLSAQFVDVYLFHFWKRLTKGKHLWLRNNGSTLISQLVDTIAVILITHYYAHALPIVETMPITKQLLVFIASGYVFKFIAALLDTAPFYLAVRYLTSYLGLQEGEESDDS